MTFWLVSIGKPFANNGSLSLVHQGEGSNSAIFERNFQGTNQEVRQMPSFWISNVHAQASKRDPMRRLSGGTARLRRRIFRFDHYLSALCGSTCSHVRGREAGSICQLRRPLHLHVIATMRSTSYEGAMLKQLAMPTRQQVEQALLRAMLKHGGVVKEFGSGEQIVMELADECGLNPLQRSAFLETVYRKENRVKKSVLWHRLLFRAADSLAKEALVTRPTQTARLTNRREWMLTESGFDQALALCKIPPAEKQHLPTKSYEVQKIVKKLLRAHVPDKYSPFDTTKRFTTITTESLLRARGFRQAVVEAYGYKCAVCGLKINSPDSIRWEVQAAHIVPNGLRGRDDICNGVALCRLHHWAFDVGWFTLLDDYKVQASPKVCSLPKGIGKIGNYELFRALEARHPKISVPARREICPHPSAISWHRQNVFHSGP